MLIGYARVSTDDQHLDLQNDALIAAGCERIYRDKASGAKAERPGLKRAFEDLRAGDTLVVWRLDRLGRSLKDLIERAEALEQRGAGLKSLKASRSSPMGRSGARIPAEALIALRARLATLTPRDAARAQEVARIAELYGVSVSSVYRRLRELHRPKGLRRADRGVPRAIPSAELERYCEIVAALKVRTENGKGHRLSTATATARRARVCAGKRGRADTRAPNARVFGRPDPRGRRQVDRPSHRAGACVFSGASVPASRMRRKTSCPNSPKEKRVTPTPSRRLRRPSVLIPLRTGL